MSTPAGYALDIDVLLVLLVGLTTLLCALARELLERVRIPGLVGFLLIGLGLRLADEFMPWTLLREPVRATFAFLASLGVVVLLFRIGLASHPRRLLSKLPPALLVWAGNVGLAALLGYLAARHALGFGLVPSLVAATALTATSIGVSVPLWQQAGRLDSDAGAVLVDVAELDDISAVLLMALLLALIPALQNGGALAAPLLQASGSLMLRLALLVAFCLLFARYLEPHLAVAMSRWERPPARLLTIVALGAMIAALAGAIGFSLAVGALFAGLIFSRDPQPVWSDRSFTALHDFLVPFFFVGIGLHIDPTALGGALGAGAVLLVAAVAGKYLGAMLPGALVLPARDASALGLSMVPRAEIAMVVLAQGSRLGPAVVPERLYGAMALVTALTCTLAPPLLAHQLAPREDRP